MNEVMTYIVLEIQKTSDTEVATIVASFNDRNEAESRYHQVLAAASISSIKKHSAVLLMDDGTFMKSETFEHLER